MLKLNKVFLVMTGKDIKGHLKLELSMRCSAPGAMQDSIIIELFILYQIKCSHYDKKTNKQKKLTIKL